MAHRATTWFEKCKSFIVSEGTFMSQNVEYAPNHTSAVISFQHTKVSLPSTAQSEIGTNVGAQHYVPRCQTWKVYLCGFWSTLFSLLVLLVSLAIIAFNVTATSTVTTHSVQYGSLPPPLTLYGHEGLIQEILSEIFLQSGYVKGQICLRGAPGIGKTAIATAIIHDPRIIHHFKNERHWVRCQQISNTTASLKAEKLLENIADTFGIELKPSSDRKKDIQFFLNNRNVPRIIVLDNFETVWEPPEARETTEDILQFLSQFSQLTMVVTTRNGHNPAMDQGVTWFAIDPIQPLSLDASRKLFMSLCRPQFIDNHLDDLLHAIGYIPFIITLMASYAQENYMTAQILEIWRRRLSQRAGEQDFTRNSDLIKLDNSIAMSLDGPLINSTTNAPALLRIIADLPGGMKKNNLQMIASAIPHAHEIVGVLVRASLVMNTPDTIRMHDYIRLFMLRNYPLDSVHIENIHSFYYHLIHDAGGEPGDPDFLERNRRLQHEEINAEAILVDALNDDFTRWAPIALDYSNYQIWNDPSINTTKAFVELIRNHPQPSTVENEVVVLQPTGGPSWSRFVNQWINTKVKVINTSPGVTSETDKTSRSLLPLALLRLGQLYYRRDMYSEAMETLEDAIKESRALRQSNISAEALLVIGHIFRLNGNNKQSFDSYSQACDEFDRNPRGIASCLRGQGIVRFSQNNIPAAIDMMNEARKACSPDDFSCLADCDRELGRVYRDIDFSESIRVSTQARKHYLAHGPLGSAALSLYHMSIALYRNQKYDEAERGLTQAIKEFQSIVNDSQVGYCIFHLGEMNLLRGMLSESLDFYRRSEAIFTLMGNHYMAGISRRRQVEVYGKSGQVGSLIYS